MNHPGSNHLSVRIRGALSRCFLYVGGYMRVTLRHDRKEKGKDVTGSQDHFRRRTKRQQVHTSFTMFISLSVALCVCLFFIRIKNVPLSQNAEEIVLGKESEVVWDDVNG